MGNHRCPGFKTAMPKCPAQRTEGTSCPVSSQGGLLKAFLRFCWCHLFLTSRLALLDVNSVSFPPPSSLDFLPLPPSKHCLALLSRLSYLDGEDCGECSSTHLTSFPHGDPVFLAASQWCPSFPLWPQHLWVLLSILGHMPGHLQALFHSLPS